LGLRLRSGFALPSAQAQRKSLTLIVAESHLDCRAAVEATWAFVLSRYGSATGMGADVPLR
jgi:hypothetical protein